MTTDGKKISLKSITATALITFLISGGGGYLLSDWQDRAKPDIIINSIGFTGSSEWIDIGDNLVNISKSVAWCKSLNRYSSYECVNGSYTKLLRVERKLKRGLNISKDWIEKKYDWKNENKPGVSISDLLSVPMCQDNIIGSLLIGSMGRDEVEQPPDSLNSIAELPEVTELIRTDEAWVLYLKTQTTSFPYDRSKSRLVRKHIERFAKSFAHGATRNIHFYISQFVKIALEDLQEVQDLKKQLEALLLPASHLSLSISIYNSGNSPLLLRPYMALKFENIELSDNTLLLQVKKQSPKKDDLSALEQHLKNRQQNKQGEDFIVDDYLPQSVGSEYTFVPPFSSRTIELVSIDELGKQNGERILGLFRANALRCYVMTISDDKTIWTSSPAFFGQSISDNDKDLLVRSIKPR